MLDLGDSPHYHRPSLIDGEALRVSGDDCRYVFLSWAWGPARAELQEMWHSDVDTRLESWIASTFPPLLQDTIAMCRQLDIRYLFCDLCLPGLYGESWDVEAYDMASWISQAEIVIAPTRSGFDQHILERPEHEISSTVITLDAYGHDISDHVQVQMRVPLRTIESITRGIFSRSWRAQEALLASRLLILDDDQALWKCGQHTLAQGSVWHQIPAFHSISSLSHMASALVSSWRIKDGGPFQANQAAASFIYSQWYRYVEMVTSGGLSKKEDRLPSAEAVAEGVSTIVEEYVTVDSSTEVSMYHQGIRTEDIHRSLLWTATTTRIPVDGQDLAPSWSWGSQSAPISYRLSLTAIARSPEFELLRVDSTEGSSRLIVRGYYRPLFVSGSPLLCDPIFDTMQAKREWQRDAGRFSFVVVTRWGYTATGDNHRWIGLILRNLDREPLPEGLVLSPEFQGVFMRAGVFLGPECHEGLADWTLQTLTIH